MGHDPHAPQRCKRRRSALSRAGLCQRCKRRTRGYTLCALCRFDHALYMAIRRFRERLK